MFDKRTIISFAVAAALLPALAGCGCSNSQNTQTEDAQSQQEQAQQEQAQQEQGEPVGIANPFIDCASAMEASSVAGFDVSFPESVPGYNQRFYQAIEGKLAQCFYSNGDTRVLVRKGTGSEDISGDYNEYPQVNQVNVGDVTVTEKGNDNLVYCAIWTKDGFSFAIDADTGLEASVIEGIVGSTL
ncbi:MAG: hypothetical protein IKG11_00625 [Atopobiaceae bacterium]|nr:hypothetical protein [Atopobiaceae bacterium]